MIIVQCVSDFSDAFQLINEGSERQRVRWYNVCSKCGAGGGGPNDNGDAAGARRLSSREVYSAETAGLQVEAARALALWRTRHVRVETGWAGGYDQLQRGEHAPWRAYWATYP